MLVYSSIVLKLTNLFSEEFENPERAWAFLLRTILVFDTERDIVSAPIFDPHTPLDNRQCFYYILHSKRVSRCHLRN